LLLAAADQSIDWKNRSHYQKAVQHLLEARVLFKQCGQSTDFKVHMETLRTAHKAKRALREELNGAGLP
jgi:uncharacterized Zn finger protein